MKDYRTAPPAKPVTFRRPIAEEDADFDATVRKLQGGWMRRAHPMLGEALWIGFLTILAIASLVAVAAVIMHKRTCRTEALDANRTLCVCPSGRGGDSVTVVRGGEECR